MKWIGAVVLVSAVVATACGSSGVSSGVDPNKSASEVTDDEAKKVCEAAQSYSESKITVDLGCRLAGVTTAAVANALSGGELSVEDLRAACDEGVELCKDEREDDGDDDSTCDSATARPAACDATVGEIETCLTAQVDAFAESLGSIPSCADLTAEDFAELGEAETPETPSECSSLPVACGLGGTGDGDGMGGAGGAGG